jgi:chromate transporter
MKPPQTPDAPPPGALELFLGWGKVGLMGFGGVTPWARRIVVEERRWLDDREYAGLLGIAQVLPGPNTPNMCVIIGQRFCGLPGAIASVVGLMIAPLLALLAIAAAYDRLSGVGLVTTIVGGAASAAAGLVIGTAVKMGRGAKLDFAGVAICAAVFVTVGVLRVPLGWAVLILGPISIALAHVRRES